MKKTYVVTENPEVEQWKLLLKYGYSSNIKKFFEEKNYPQNDELTEFIGGSILQAHAYFESAKNSSLYITPLLIYYGVINLLAGAASLRSGVKKDIRGHGMNMTPPGDLKDGIGNALITINNSEHGGFSIFNEIFTDNTLPNGIKWSLKELFSVIPDIRTNYEDCYSVNSNILPVEIVKLRDRTIERINYDEYPYIKESPNLLEKVTDLNKNYLKPEFQTDRVIFNRKMKFKDIGVYSMYGRKYLQLSFEKQGKKVNLSLLIAMYTGLFGLGFLSRYNPSIWNPFVQKDMTGEKLLVEKFLSVSIRHIPNLILNYIEDKNIHFINETDGITDLRFNTLSGNINKIVEEQLEYLLHGKGMR